MPSKTDLRVLCGLMVVLCLWGEAGISQTSVQPVEPSARPTPQAGVEPELPTVFVVGDSTANNNANGQQGWADPFTTFFDPMKVNVVNRARAGRSSRTFLTEGLWHKVLEEMKAGDFVLIQFGHNDGGPMDTGRARGSLPGLGEETREVTFPDGRKEVVHTYGWYLRRFISDAKAKRATPIILSLTVRNIWKNGRVERGSGNFRQWAAEVASAQRVDFVDVTALVADKYEAMGQEKVQELFAGDHTHTSPLGAEMNASIVIAGLKKLKPCTLCNYLSVKAK